VTGAGELLMDLAIAAGDALAGRRMSAAAREKLQQSYDQARAYLHTHLRELEPVGPPAPRQPYSEG